MSTLRFFKITSKVSVGRGAAAMWPSSRFCRKFYLSWWWHHRMTYYPIENPVKVARGKILR